MLSRQGYHASDSLWLELPSPLSELSIPVKPSVTDVTCAAGLIDELLADFPFVSAADRAHAIALLLLPFVRRLIPGPTPLHVVESPTPGSGKSLLADVIALIATGQGANVTTMSVGEEETRKKLTALLFKAPTMIVLDNVSEHLDSAQLAAAITANSWTDRVLGSSQTVSLPNRAAWVMTANNPTSQMELARRSVRIRIDPKSDQPWRRTGFRHSDLRSWVRQNQPRLVSAVLVFVNAWKAAGQPESPKASMQVLGSFEDWSSVMRGVLHHVGIHDFLGNLDEMYETADAEGAAWRRLCVAWSETHGTRPLDATSVLAMVEEIPDLATKVRGVNDKSRASSLGKLLRKQRERKFGGFEIAIDERDSSHTRYRLLEPILPPDVADDVGTNVGDPESLGHKALPDVPDDSEDIWPPQQNHTTAVAMPLDERPVAQSGESRKTSVNLGIEPKVLPNQLPRASEGASDIPLDLGALPRHIGSVAS